VRGQIPAMLFNWLVPVQETFLEVSVAASGAAHVAVSTERPPAPDGQVHGVPAVELVSTVTWA
jgi:hypothetical protein